jgi:hypothetical protein
VSVLLARVWRLRVGIATLLERHQELNQVFLFMFGGTTPEYAALFGEVAKNTELALEEAIKLAPAKVPLKDSPKGSFPIDRRHQDPVSSVSAEHFSKRVMRA